MPQYILRDLPEGLWKRVKSRAERDGWPLRALMLQLLEDFAVGRVTPGGTPPSTTASPTSVTARGTIARLALRDRSYLVTIPDIRRGVETDTDLILYDEMDQVHARFPRANVESWSIEVVE